MARITIGTDIAHAMKPIEKVVDGDKPPSVAAQAPPFDLDKAAISCAVCLEILHNPVNISPCNHKFCGGCIFRWMDGNQSCPQCRNGVHDITKDGFAAKICEDYLKAYPGQCRSQVVKNELDQNELHYLQKLKDRMDRTASVAQAHMQNFGRDNIHREFRREHSIIGGGVRRLSRNPSHRGLHLTPCRYRDHQWAQRIKRLREQLHIPARAVTPPQHIEPAASRRIPGEHGGIIFGVMRALETPPHVRQLRAARFGTAGRRLVYPAGGTNRVPSPPRQNLSRDERRARRERRRQEAERQQAVHDPRAILQFFIGRLSAEHIDEDTSSRS